MDDILTIILKDTYSLSQLKHRLRILKARLLKTFFGDNTNDLSSTPSDLEWSKSLPANFYEKFNKDNVYQIFAELDTTIANLPVITLYLTFEPDQMTLDQIGIFARNTFGPTALLDIRLDINLIAGAAISWKGVLRDYSFRAKIDSKKSEILQEFKKFLR